MGFLDFLKPPPPPPPPKNVGGRPTKAQAAEKRRQALADKKLQLELKRIDQELRELESGNQSRGLDTDTVLLVVRYLKQLGLEVRPAKGGPAIDEDGLGGMLRQFAQAVGPAIGMGVVRGLTPQAQNALAQQLPAAPETPAPATHQQPQEAQSEMSFVSLYLGNALGGKSPSERAQWLLSQQEPTLQGLLAQLCQLPDGQLMACLIQVAQQHPQYAPVANWVLGQGELWIVETVRELRRLKEPPASASPITGQ